MYDRFQGELLRHKALCRFEVSTIWQNEEGNDDSEEGNDDDSDDEEGNDDDLDDEEGNDDSDYQENVFWP